MQFMSGEDTGQWLEERLTRARSLLVVSPFITKPGVEAIVAVLEHPQRAFDLQVLTNIDDQAVLFGALNLEVLARMLELGDRYKRKSVSVRHLDGLHAKVFVPGHPRGSEAVVGSANLTGAATRGRNTELGALVRGKSFRDVQGRVGAWWKQGLAVNAEDLRSRYQLLRDNYSHLFAASKIDTGSMQIYPEPDGGSPDYFGRLRKTLRWCDKKARTEAELKAKLKEGKDKGPERIRNRFVYLQRLGLLQMEAGRPSVTERGRRVAKSKSSALELFELLHDTSREVAVVYEALLGRDDAEFTYEVVRRLVAGDLRRGAVDNVIRWLVSLGVVRRIEDHANKNNQRTFELHPSYRAARG